MCASLPTLCPCRPADARCSSPDQCSKHIHSRARCICTALLPPLHYFSFCACGTSFSCLRCLVFTPFCCCLLCWLVTIREANC